MNASPAAAQEVDKGLDDLLKEAKRGILKGSVAGDWSRLKRRRLRCWLQLEAFPSAWRLYLSGGLGACCPKQSAGLSLLDTALAKESAQHENVERQASRSFALWIRWGLLRLVVSRPAVCEQQK